MFCSLWKYFGFWERSFLFLLEVIIVAVLIIVDPVWFVEKREIDVYKLIFIVFKVFVNQLDIKFVYMMNFVMVVQDVQDVIRVLFSKFNHIFHLDINGYLFRHKDLAKKE